MLIVCKTCASSYHIPREILGETGCQLRCVGCGEAWTVGPEPLAAGDAPVVEGQRVRIEPPPAARNSSGRRLAVFSRKTKSDSYGLNVPPKAVQAPFPRARNVKKALLAFAAVVAVSSAMGALAGRTAIVKAAPATARIFAAVGLPVNLRGLALDNVRTNIFDLGDRKMLVVEGAVVNLRDAAVEAPNMRIALRGADKRELYVWTAPAPKARLGPNEQVAFRTRLAAPPDGVSDVMVRFASGADRLSPMNEGL